jgi:hypothetical protein
VQAAACSQTTDQRGVPRPPSDCDAGSYQFAPPAIAGFLVKATSATTATVTAMINPNLSALDTTVTIHYGTTTTAAKDIGRGGTAVPFSAALTGLMAGTTYHVELVATNAVGTTDAGPQAIKTPAYSRLHARVSFTWLFTSSYTTAERLKVLHVPAAGKVEVSCRGDGCPFKRRTFRPKHASVSLTGAFKGRRLKPRSRVEIAVTAPSSIGEVWLFTIHPGQSPSEAASCLVPGASKATRCK